MVVLLHKIEAASTVQLLYAFSKFSSVQVFKPAKIHAKRSSFYMIATDVRVESEEARAATQSLSISSTVNKQLNHWFCLSFEHARNRKMQRRISISLLKSLHRGGRDDDEDKI